MLRCGDDSRPIGGGPGCAERGDAVRQKFSAIEFTEQEYLPILLFWTVVLARENVNAKETIEQNTGADKNFQFGR